MNTVTINNEINLSYPDSFNEMGEEELAKYFGSPQNRWGAHDAENHVVLSVGWTKKKLLSFLADAESALIGAEARLSRNLVNYQRITSYKPKLGKKKKARAIRFEYRVNDSVSIHVGDLVVFKHKKKIYSVYYICRKSKAAEVLPAFEEVLKSISF